MTIYEHGATVTLSIEAASDATVEILVTAPNGAETTPTPTFSSPNWSVSFPGSQYDTWLYAWSVDGDIVEQGSFVVGGPWYVTLAALRKSINRQPGDDTADDFLAGALEGASRSVEQWCDSRPKGGFLLADTASARVYRPSTRGPALPGVAFCTEHGYRLHVHDIGAGSYTVETSTDGSTWTELAEGTDYEAYPDNALALGRAIEAFVSPSEWPARVRITARWGWPTVPSAVVEATRIQARRLYARKNTPEGVMGASDWGLIRVPNLDPDVKALLAHLHTEAFIA